MKISVAKDQVSGVWNLSTDLFHDEDPVNLELDAALFDQDQLARVQPKQGALILSNNTFQLSRGAGDNSNSCALKIDKSVARFDVSSPEYREPLVGDFNDFVQQTGAHEADFIRPGASDLLRRVVANVLPASFAENLYFHYGFSRRNLPAAGGQQFCVDLQAGMRLRLESQFSQLVLPSPTQFDPLVNGFVPGSQSFFNIVDVSNNGKPQLGFDAFLATNPLTQVDASQGGAGGMIDLLATRRRYFRICYPSQYSSSDSPGFQGQGKNVTLLGADDIPTLENATTTYFQRRAFTGSEPAAVFFRGRTIAIPEILCFLNGAATYVPVGTTVRQLFSRFTVIPRLAGFSPSKFPYQRLAPDSRFVQHSLFGGFDGAFPDTYTTVSFQSATVVSGPQDAYDLPVLAGDSYQFK
jgi:hypothetical protein